MMLNKKLQRYLPNLHSLLIESPRLWRTELNANWGFPWFKLRQYPAIYCGPYRLAGCLILVVVGRHVGGNCAGRKVGRQRLQEPQVGRIPG